MRPRSIFFAVSIPVGLRACQARRPTQHKLVDIVYARLPAHLVELLAKLGWKQLREAPPQSRFARGPRQPLDLRIPALHPIVQIHGQNPDVNGFDDILAELFQPLVLLHLALQRTVQPRVLHRDADISGESGQQLHVVTRKKIALVGAAQRQVCDGAAADRTREIVGQIEIGDGPPHRDRPVVRDRVQQMPGALKEQIRLPRVCTDMLAQKTQVELLPLLLTALLAIAQGHMQPELVAFSGRFVQ